MITLAGPVLGSIIMTFVLAANVATMVIMLYLAGVSIQQIKPLTRVRWDILIALMLLPGVYVAFRTEWTLSIVMSWLSYNGVMFVGITGVTFVDYFILRKETLAPAHLFTRDPASQYWFWGRQLGSRRDIGAVDCLVPLSVQSGDGGDASVSPCVGSRHTDRDCCRRDVLPGYEDVCHSCRQGRIPAHYGCRFVT